LPDSAHTENSENSIRNGQQKLQAFLTLVEDLEVASREAGICARRKAIVFRIQDFLFFLFFSTWPFGWEISLLYLWTSSDADAESMIP